MYFRRCAACRRGLVDKGRRQRGREIDGKRLRTPEDAAAKAVRPALESRARSARGPFVGVARAELVLRVEIVIELRVDLFPAQVCRRRQAGGVGAERSLRCRPFRGEPSEIRRYSGRRRLRSCSAAASCPEACSRILWDPPGCGSDPRSRSPWMPVPTIGIGTIRPCRDVLVTGPKTLA